MDIIVCIDKNNGIGKDGGLLFRIPEDMAYFRRMTVNKTVIVGGPLSLHRWCGQN